MTVSTAPTFEGVVGDLIRARLHDLHTGMPGVIVSYDRASQSCSVQPAIPHAFLDEEQERISDELPQLVHVPVQFPGSGANSITWELVPGDVVWIKFSQRSMDAFMRLGRLGLDTEDDRHHDLSDAVVEPGLRSFASPLPPEAVAAAAMVVRYPNELRLGGAAADDGVVRESDNAKIVDALTIAIAQLTLGGDPSATALQAFKTALTNPPGPTGVGFPTSSPDVKLR